MRGCKFNENFFETIDSEEKAYWLGFLAADGCIHLKSWKMTLNLAEKDREHLIKFKVALDTNRPLYKRINKRYNTIIYRLQLYSKKMFNDLMDKGITPRKSLTLEPPKNVPEELIRHWIRGYFDGDGCVYITKNNLIRFSIIGTTKVLNFINLQYNSFFRVEIAGKSKAFKIRAGGDKALKFLDYIYNNSSIFLERKKIKFIEVLS